MLKRFFVILVLSSLTALYADAQVDTVPFLYDREIVSKPAITTPSEAVQTGLSGTVLVLVTVDADGNVIAVDDAIGPGAVCKQVQSPDVLALRQAASEVARDVKFAPIKEGQLAIARSWAEFVFAKNENDTEELVEPPEPTSPAGPSTARKPGQKNTNSTFKGDVSFSAATVAPARSGEPVKPGKQTDKGVKGEKYTVVRDYNRAAVSSGKPGYAIRGKRVSGGVLNGKALALPKPEYPRAASAVDVSGAVTVQVLVDVDGKVFSAYALSGHPLLRANSIAAACKAEFSRVLLMDTPVKVTGVITYNYVP